MEQPTPDPAIEAARAQLEADAYNPTQPAEKFRAPALAYGANDVVQDAARDLQAAIDALVAYHAEHGPGRGFATSTPVLEALRQIARLRRACGDAEDAISRALILGHVAAPALAHYMDMPTDSMTMWAQGVWQQEGRSMYERDDESDGPSPR